MFVWMASRPPGGSHRRPRAKKLRYASTLATRVMPVPGVPEGAARKAYPTKLAAGPASEPAASLELLQAEHPLQEGSIAVQSAAQLLRIRRI